MLPKVRSEECGVRSCGAALLRFIKRNDLPITSSYLLAFFCLPFQNMREAHTTTPHFYLLISHSSILPAYSLFQIIRRKADTATPHFSLLTPNSINTSSRLLSPSSIIFVRFCSHVTRFRQYVQMNQQNLALLPKRKKALAFFAKL